MPTLIRLLPILAVLGCGIGKWVPTLEGNDLAQRGMDASQFDDGCTLDISHVPIVIHEAVLSNESNFDIAIADITNILLETTNDGPVRLWEEEVGAYQYNWHKLRFAPGIATLFGEGVDEAFAKEFDSMNGSFGLYGTLTCGENQVELRWVFSRTVEVKCRYIFKVPKDGEGSVPFEIDPSQLFRQSATEDGSDAILGQAIATSDLNGDGVVNLHELAEVPLSSLSGYGEDPTDPVKNLYQLIEKNNERVIRLDGQTCTLQDS